MDRAKRIQPDVGVATPVRMQHFEFEHKEVHQSW
jgi:hypothetical protein